jgi:hypothetical protein
VRRRDRAPHPRAGPWRGRGRSAHRAALRDTFAGRVFAARDRRDVESLLADLPLARLLGRLARARAGPQAAVAAVAKRRRGPTLTLVGLPLSDGASIVLGRGAAPVT